VEIAAGDSGTAEEQAQEQEKETDQMVQDPVCGMSIDPAKAAAEMEHGGKTYYFCSHDCHGRFAKNPKAYAK